MMALELQKTEEESSMLSPELRGFMGHCNHKNVLLSVGSVVVSDEPVIYWTPLGPCVSVIFHDPVTKVCAATHSFLPEESQKQCKLHESCPRRCFRCNEKNDNRVKYVTGGISYVVSSLEEKKIDIAKMDIYLFGGAKKEPCNDDNGPCEHRNSIAAVNMISSLNLTIKFKDVGGNKGRIIFFNSANGDYKINYV